MPLPNMVGAIGRGLRNVEAVRIGMVKRSTNHHLFICKLDVRTYMYMDVPVGAAGWWLPTDLAEQSESTIEIYGTDDRYI